MINTDKPKAQSNSKPKLKPASVQTMTVPGPMKAAATSGPGPIFWRSFLMGDNFPFRKNSLLGRIFVIDS